MSVKYTGAQLATLRADLHKYVDTICDYEDLMQALALTNGDRESVEKNRVMGGNLAWDYNGVRNHGNHKQAEPNDPTGNAALRPNPYRDWISAVHRMYRDMQTMRDFAVRFGGTLVPVCDVCRREIKSTDKIVNNQHRACYDKARR